MPEIISKLDAKAAGLTRYFTGEACIRGHIAERMICSGDCLICKRMAGQRYRNKNKEKEKERHAKYHQENFEKFREYKKSYNKKYHHQLMNKNREKLSEYWRKAYEANPERVKKRAYFRTLCKRGKGDIKLTSEEKTINDLIYQLRDELNQQAGFIKYNVDHIIPFKAAHYQNGKRLSFSGFHHPINLKIITAKENNKKKDRFRPVDVLYFLENIHWWINRKQYSKIFKQHLSIPQKN